MILNKLFLHAGVLKARNLRGYSGATPAFVFTLTANEPRTERKYNNSSEPVPPEPTELCRNRNYA